jgi:endoglucanase
LVVGAVSSLLTGGGAAHASLLVDDFEDGDTVNALGGTWATDTDGYSTTDGFTIGTGDASTHAGHFDYMLAGGASYPYVELITYLLPDESTAGIDLSAYAGLRFVAKGTGTFTVEFATSETAAQYNYYQAYVAPAAEWTEIQIPFSSLVQTFGAGEPWDPTTVFAIVWESLDRAGASGELYLDNVELYSADEAMPVQNNALVAAPKVNQLGYLPSGDKTFHVTVGAPAQPGDPFSVLDATTGQAVLSGTLSATAVDDTAVSGESVLVGDFSTLAVPGRYLVSVDGTQSPPFDVGDDLYTSLFRDAIRAFYIIRCGIAIADAETGIQHPACHTADAVLRTDRSTSLNLTGGWHNAGDFGKWTHEAAISASYMMWLYELNASGVGSLDTGIPESGDAVPDVLDEARWGLTWLLKMQQPDGSVMHKVDTEPNFAWGLSPEKDPNLRSAGLASTIDAAEFAAVMAQAARVFKTVDPAFAASCLTAAQNAWTWTVANPGVGETDIYYTDPDPSQEVSWALGEMVRATHDPTLTETFAAGVQGDTLTALSWKTPEILGYVAVAMDPQADATLQASVVSKLTSLCDGLATTAESAGYGVATTSAQYYWESNEDLLHRTAALLFGAAATGNDAYRRLALRQLDWLLGDNSLNRSFVTGHGSNPIAHPYHWTAYALGKLMPGWGGGGPNRYAAGADLPLIGLIDEGAPPAKCYLDLGNAAGSYASNEGETSENAALAFTTGMFVANRGDAGADASNPARAPASGGCSCELTGRESPIPQPFGPAHLWTVGILAGVLQRRRARSPARHGLRPLRTRGSHARRLSASTEGYS